MKQQYIQREREREREREGERERERGRESVCVISPVLPTVYVEIGSYLNSLPTWADFHYPMHPLLRCWLSWQQKGLPVNWDPPRSEGSDYVTAAVSKMCVQS